MRAQDATKALLERFTLDQLHDLCREYKRGMRHQDYLDTVVLGETDAELVKKRFIPHVARFFDRADVVQYAKKHQIPTD
ncbi:MAG TPA: hypothetical protein VJ792_00340 [Candidatus Nitrosotalea sp.]|nr:hypothetical protein [Candidatus Nitrosotalea sp.]